MEQNWQLFTYKESKKNVETGEFDELGRYTIFVNNPQSSLQNGDLVEIKSITKSLIEKNVVNNKDRFFFMRTPLIKIKSAPQRRDAL